VWGSSFWLIKMGLVTFTPTEVAAVRLAAAAALPVRLMPSRRYLP